MFNQLYNLIKTDKFVFFQQFFEYLKLVLDDNIDEKRENLAKIQPSRVA